MHLTQVLFLLSHYMVSIPFARSDDVVLLDGRRHYYQKKKRENNEERHVYRCSTTHQRKGMEEVTTARTAVVVLFLSRLSYLSWRSALVAGRSYILDVDLDVDVRIILYLNSSLFFSFCHFLYCDCLHFQNLFIPSCSNVYLPFKKRDWILITTSQFTRD